jgi:hypothetical protein
MTISSRSAREREWDTFNEIRRGFIRQSQETPERMTEPELNRFLEEGLAQIRRRLSKHTLIAGLSCELYYYYCRTLEGEQLRWIPEEIPGGDYDFVRENPPLGLIDTTTSIASKMSSRNLESIRIRISQNPDYPVLYHVPRGGDFGRDCDFEEISASDLLHFSDSLSELRNRVFQLPIFGIPASLTVDELQERISDFEDIISEIEQCLEDIRITYLLNEFLSLRDHANRALNILQSSRNDSIDAVLTQIERLLQQIEVDLQVDRGELQIENIHHWIRSTELRELSDRFSRLWDLREDVMNIGVENLNISQFDGTYASEEGPLTYEDLGYELENYYGNLELLETAAEIWQDHIQSLPGMEIVCEYEDLLSLLEGGASSEIWDSATIVNVVFVSFETRMRNQYHEVIDFFGEFCSRALVLPEGDIVIAQSRWERVGEIRHDFNDIDIEEYSEGMEAFLEYIETLPENIRRELLESSQIELGCIEEVRNRVNRCGNVFIGYSMVDQSEFEPDSDFDAWTEIIEEYENLRFPNA